MRIFEFAFITGLIAVTTVSGKGQAQFVNRALEYGINHQYGNGTAGGGVSFADFNGDFRDDLTFASSDGGEIHFYINRGTSLEKINLLPALLEEVKHVLWVDFDNDGDRDLYLTMADNYNRLYRNVGNLQLEDITEEMGLSTEIFTSFGAVWGDYNRDGFADLYYGLRRIESTGEPNISKLWMNRKNRFVEVTTESNTEDGGKTPFCSAFFDYNHDKWPDLYTAHDRKRGNTLLKNNGDGTFSDVSVQTGTDLKMDGMSASVSDYNLDGFDDLYVSNSEAGNALLVNRSGEYFTNDADTCGVGFYSIAWGTNFLDGDLDGDPDLYVSGMLPGRFAINSQYYVNNFPENTFDPGVKIEGDTASSFNNAVGDINDDGAPDIAVMNVGPYPTMLHVNSGSPNNYIKVSLQGVKSNRDGIGAVITLFANGRAQHRYMDCGTGFMGQNSYTTIFGIGQSVMADSIKVLWPTGHIDLMTSVAAGQRFHITEGMTTGGVINVDDDVTLLDPTHIDDVYFHDALVLTLHPNPTASSATITCYIDGDKFDKVTIYNMSGKKIVTFVASPNQNEMRFTSPEIPGLYHVTAITSRGLQISKNLMVR